jgi:peroxiredoxin
MAETPSTMRELGTAAPDFSLPATDGSTVSLSDYAGRPLLVAFICNHCPFVKHLGSALGDAARKYEELGVGVVLINANDVTTHPEDAPEKMPAFLAEYGITAPYLYDESQEVAKAYTAACTPDFFLFDAGHTLVYRGQFDDSRPGRSKPITGADLTAAVEAVARGEAPRSDQKPSVGCNIKWKSGNEPSFFRMR